MIVNDENKNFILEAMKVDFLTEQWERQWYALALMRAEEWGKKKDEENKRYSSIKHLVDKYNV